MGLQRVGHDGSDSAAAAGINLPQNNNHLLRLCSYFNASIPSISINEVPAESGVVLDPEDEVVNRTDILFASM